MANAASWSKLNPREKIVIASLAAFLLLGVYTKAVHEPVSKMVKGYDQQIKKSKAQLTDLKTKMPQDEEVAEKITKLQADGKKLSGELQSLEQRIPSRFQLAQLVGEFTRLANEVKLDSVSQRIVKDQGYSRIFLEVKFFASYMDAIQYLSAIESISPFLRVEEMEILEPKGKNVEMGGSPVRLLVSCLLSESTEGGQLKASSTQDSAVKRDILASSSRPTALLEESKFTLEGITFDPKNPSAIINGDVYTVGSQISGYKVKKILQGSVLLSDGVEDHLLNLRGGSQEEEGHDAT